MKIQFNIFHFGLSGWLLLVLPGLLQADGGYYYEATPLAQSAQSADQQAIIIYEDGVESLIIRTGHKGNPQNYAWVIPTPVPLSPEAVTTVDNTVFEVLDNMTAPVFVREWGGCFGCSAGGKMGEYPGVTIWEYFQIEGYEIVTLSAEDSQNLERWLRDNGYSIPEGSQNILQHYLEKDWKFVAVKVNAKGTGAQSNKASADGEKTEELRPIKLTFSSDSIVYPLRISAVSTKEEVEILLCVIADHRVKATNFPTAEMEAKFENAATRYDWSIYYDSQFQKALMKSGSRGFVVEYANHLEEAFSSNNHYYYNYHYDEYGSPLDSIWDWKEGKDYYITRLRTLFQPQDMQNDLILAWAESDEPVFTRIEAAGLTDFFKGGSGGRLEMVLLGIGLSLILFVSGYRRSLRVLIRGMAFLLLFSLIFF